MNTVINNTSLFLKELKDLETNPTEFINSFQILFEDTWKQSKRGSRTVTAGVLQTERKLY